MCAAKTTEDKEDGSRGQNKAAKARCVETKRSHGNLTTGYTKTKRSQYETGKSMSTDTMGIFDKETKSMSAQYC
jgi:hypothetical protein